MDGKREGKCSKRHNPKIWLTATNTYFLHTGLWVGRSSAELSWACWDSLSLLSLCPKIKRQPLSGASYTRKQKPKGQAMLKVLLKVYTQNWSLCLPSTRHWSKQAVTQQSPKLRGQEGEYTVPIRKDGQVGGWMNN